MQVSNTMKKVALSLSLTLAAAHTAEAAAPAAQPAEPLTVKVFTAGEAGFNVTSTLIYGAKEAVVIDSQFTLSEAHRLAAEILASGRTLRQIFVTHAHPDHFFGAEVLLQQFPEAKLIARPAVVEEAEKLAPEKVKFWKPIYGADLTSNPVIPEPFTGSALTVDGQELQIIDLAGGESEVASAVYIPAAKTLVAGDLAFNHVHLWLAEGRPEGWLTLLANVQAQYPVERLIAGHKDPAQSDDQDLFAQDARYIRDFERIVKEAATPEEALQKLTALYPDYKLPVIADIAVKAAKAP